ncbi:MAG: glycoside hydrolase family 97 protein [Prevotella sp.]|nr:glycoside hydrolase family 97 protein [Prevotella sp.]
MNRFWISLVLFCVSFSVQAKRPVSPNGKLSVETTGQGMVVYHGQQKVLDIPVMAMGTDTKPLKLKKSAKIKTDYKMLAGKKLRCRNEANEYVAKLGNGRQLVVRLYDDGLAFRYELSGLNNDSLPKEQTIYHIPEGTKRWMMEWSDAYEGFFPLSTTGKVKASRRSYAANAEGYIAKWGYPSLLEPTDGIFVLLTEANIERRQSASFLWSEGEDYYVTPDENKILVSGEWHSPWRVAIIGQLSDVVESTLVTDVCEDCKLEDVSWVKPGVVSWIYWAYNHGSNDYNIIKKYVDMAVVLKLPYVLIDAEWDEMKDGKTIEDAVAYAKSQGVKPMIWYNSSVGWVNGAPGPKYRLNKPEDREKEFAWCERIGVAGVKIDFFSGDNQMNMDYCIDLIEAAAKHHLLVNFHGATIPRGWQRTYPNLLTTEAVYGAEWYNNVPTFTDKAACHNTTLPFTRNVIGPMDYTPCTFSDSQHPHITTKGHELALTVLYESGLQHLADKPESYLAQPQEVQDFFSHLPVAWDETRLVAGYPGKFAVVARHCGTTWYVAGINGTDEEMTIPLDFFFIDARSVTAYKSITVFTDESGQQDEWKIYSTDRFPNKMVCKPRGGFVFMTK